jgi:hypothetical protein
LNVIPSSDVAINPVSWIAHQGGTSEVPRVYNQVTCPTGATHCFQAGDHSIFLKTFNVSVAFVSVPEALSGHLVETILKFQILGNDVIIANTGLRYTLPQQYKEEIHNLYGILQTLNLANFYFLESTPQHFTRVCCLV